MMIISTGTVVVCKGTRRDCQCHRYLLLRQSQFLRAISTRQMLQRNERVLRF